MKRAEAIHTLRGLLEIGRESQIVTQGTSMEPFLKAGDLVQVETVSPSQLRVGDLIAFQQEGALIVHRFAGWVNRSGTRFLFQKGDNLRGHGLLQPEALVGRVVSVEHGAKKRHLLRGHGLAWNRLLGFWAWANCFAREKASWLKGRFLRRERAAQPGRDSSKEEEILILATRLELSDIQEARLGVRLVEEPRWALLLEHAYRFGMMPLLHHHFSRPVLAAMLPAEVKEILAKAYHQTSLKNLRMLGLLRRFLLKAREAGVEVILLKGAFLATWIYGDVGLRPMGDLDLLCHKEDEPSIQKILESMGGFKSTTITGSEPDMSPLQASVVEKIGHSAPWWFPDICRIEVHYHLLSRVTVDDTWLQEILWSKAVAHDWDGLEVRSLDPEHLIIHLASHLQHHLEEQVLTLYWVADIREVIRRYRGALDHSFLVSQARRLGLEQDCVSVFRLIGESWGVRSVSDDEASMRSLAALIGIARHQTTGSSTKRTVSGYISMIHAVRHAKGLPDKVRYLRDLCFPPTWKLASEYGTTNRLILPLLYLVHPFARLLQGLRGTLQNLQRRLGH